MHSIFQSKDYLPQQMIILIAVFTVSSLFTLFILENKFHSKVKTFLLSLLIMYLSLFPKHFDGLPLWTNQLILISFFLSNVFLYKDKWFTKILAGVIAFLVDMFADYFSYFIAIVILREDVNEYLHKPYVYFMMFSIFSTLFFINTLIWNRFYRVDKNNIFKNNVLILILSVGVNINLFSIFIPVVANIMDYISPELKNSINSFFMLYLIISVLFYLFMIYLIKDTYRYQKIKEEKEKLDYQYKIQSEYYQKLEENIYHTAKLHHDINNIVQTIQIQFAQKTPESYEKAQKITEELTALTQSIQLTKYCQNRVVNVVLADKISRAEKLQIETVCDVLLGENEYISDLDMCRIFANLLDNAISAVENLNQNAQKKIIISCKEKMDSIHIRCENCFEDTSKKRRKSDGRLHGYGLNILREISEKYHGMMEISKEANQFVVRIMLKKEPHTEK